MDLVLDNLQRLIWHKTQLTNQPCLRIVNNRSVQSIILRGKDRWSWVICGDSKNKIKAWFSVDASNRIGENCFTGKFAMFHVCSLIFCVVMMDDKEVWSKLEIKYFCAHEISVRAVCHLSTEELRTVNVATTKNQRDTKTIIWRTTRRHRLSDMTEEPMRRWLLANGRLIWGARGVMVIVVGNGHDDTSSNPGRNWLHFT